MSLSTNQRAVFAISDQPQTWKLNQRPYLEGVQMTGTQENRNVENYGGDTAKADRGSSMGGYFLFTTKTVGEKLSIAL